MAYICHGSARRILRCRASVQTVYLAEDPGAEQPKTGKEELGLVAGALQVLAVLKASSSLSVLPTSTQLLALMLAGSRLAQAGRSASELEAVESILAFQLHAWRHGCVQVARALVSRSRVEPMTLVAASPGEMKESKLEEPVRLTAHDVKALELLLVVVGSDRSRQVHAMPVRCCLLSACNLPSDLHDQAPMIPVISTRDMMMQRCQEAA